MHILLPPSETKRSGGGTVFSAESLGDHAVLGQARARVHTALETLSVDAGAAASALKLGARSRGEIANNLALASSGAMPAIERYTGVLYDALAAPTLDSAARSWLGAHVSVQSALFGRIAADDAIPAYRLSASSRLPDLDGSLKAVWRAAHSGIDWVGRGWVLDLRSKDYVELAPLPAGAGSFLHVAQRGPDGAVRALNHFNKAAKGDLVRRLALSGARIGSAAELLDWGTANGLDLSLDPESGRLTLLTDLGRARAGTASGTGAVGAGAGSR